MSGIVVGVDGSDGASQALEWAAAEARLRDAELTEVFAWQWPLPVTEAATWIGVNPELIEDTEKLAEQRLADACAAVPALRELRVTRKTVEGSAAQALIEAASEADLLVVGTRGRGGFVGLLLGSVSQQCAQHGRCPVVIVPPKAT
jgi:nucleotide-binding universal stress UspA family protein